MKKTILLTATLLGLISVLIGAFGSHSIKDYLIGIERVNTFEISVRYQFYHVFFLLILGLSYDLFDSLFIKYAFFSCLLGVILFSGSLYVLCLTNNSFFGIITPFGGISLVIAWAFFFISIIRSK